MKVFDIYSAARFYGWSGFKVWFGDKLLGASHGGIEHAVLMSWRKLKSWNRPTDDRVYLVKTKQGYDLKKPSEWKGVTHWCEILEP